MEKKERSSAELICYQDNLDFAVKKKYNSNYTLLRKQTIKREMMKVKSGLRGVQSSAWSSLFLKIEIDRHTLCMILKKVYYYSFSIHPTSLEFEFMSSS